MCIRDRNESHGDRSRLRAREGPVSVPVCSNRRGSDRALLTGCGGFARRGDRRTGDPRLRPGMIRPAGFRGAFFGDASDGNGRDDPAARVQISDAIGVSTDWAFVDQVHGATVLGVHEPGLAGSADGMITDRPGLPLAIATADCLPIIVEGCLLYTSPSPRDRTRSRMP